MDFKRLIKNIAILAIVIIFLILSFYFVFIKSREKINFNYYKQGLEYYKKNDYQNAYYNFSKIYPFSSFYLNSVFKQAKCADLLDDTKTALNKYKTFETFIKNEDITPFVLWREGNIYYKKENSNKAKAVFQKLNREYKNTEYGIASNYMLYKIENKNEYLIEYLKQSPKGRYSIDLIENVLKENKTAFSDNQKLIIANALFENEKYKEEIEILKTVPINYSWVYLVKALDKLNSSQNVIKVAEKGFSLGNENFDENLLDEAMSIYLKYSDNPYTASDKIFNNAKNPVLKGIALYKNSELSAHEDNILKKRKFCENYKNSKFAPSALFYLFTESLKNDKIPLALKYGKIHISLYNDRETTPLILYFSAYYKKKSLEEDYKLLVSRLFEEYPNSYYSYLAYSNLINKNFHERRNLKVKDNQKIPFPYQKDKKIKNFYENFIKLNDFEPFDDFRIKDNVVLSWLEYKKGNRAISSVIARDYILNSNELPERENVVWMLAYPIYYAKEINESAYERNLNPYLFLSLIKEESHFNPNIKSAVGAVGLTQIMPSTAEMMTGNVYSDSELQNEDLNIKLGANYFSYLMDEFLNKEEYCVLSYNSGPNAVKRWLSENQNLPFEIMVEKIPYPETKSYIKKVYGAYWNYILTYENLKLQ